jgi:hypothetical protein
MNQDPLSKKLQSTLDKTVDNKLVFGVSVCIENKDRSLAFAGAAGNLQAESQYFIASTT